MKVTLHTRLANPKLGCINPGVRDLPDDVAVELIATHQADVVGIPTADFSKKVAALEAEIAAKLATAEDEEPQIDKLLKKGERMKSPKETTTKKTPLETAVTE